MNPILNTLKYKAGIHFMGVPNVDFQTKEPLLRQTAEGFACDAQPSLVTVSNSGIPSFLSTYIDPKVIEILVARTS